MANDYDYGVGGYPSVGAGGLPTNYGRMGRGMDLGAGGGYSDSYFSYGPYQNTAPFGTPPYTYDPSGQPYGVVPGPALHQAPLESDPKAYQRYQAQNKPSPQDLENWYRQAQINERADAQIGAFGLAKSFYEMQGAPDLEQNQITKEQLANQIAYQNANDTAETRYLNQEYGYKSRLNELGKQSTQVDIAANKRQPGFLTTLHDIAQRGFDVTRTRGADIQRLAQQGFDVERAQANTNAARNQFNQFNESVGKGNVLTGGYGVQRNQIAQDLLHQTQNININAATSAQQYLEKIQNTNLSSEEETARYYEKMAATGDTAKQLDLQAQKYGITGEQLQFELGRGLERLHLNTATNVQDLFSKMKSANINDRVWANNVVNQAMQNSSLFEPGGLGYNIATR